MAKKCGPYAVHVKTEAGEDKWFYPGDEIDAASAKLIDNPLAFEGGEEKAEPMETFGNTEPPPAPGHKGATKEAWQNYANHYHVAFSQEMSPKELQDACADAGIPV
jgi:hypothetical protein